MCGISKNLKTELFSSDRWFPKGWFWRMFLDPQNPERGHKKRNDGTKNRNEGTKNGATVQKNRNGGTFAKTALLQNHPF